jgi:hypothetical protein
VCRRVVWRRSCTSPLSAGFYRKFDLWLLSVDLLTYDRFHRPPVVVAVGDYNFNVHENFLGASSSFTMHSTLGLRAPRNRSCYQIWPGVDFCSANTSTGSIQVVFALRLLSSGSLATESPRNCRTVPSRMPSSIYTLRR